MFGINQILYCNERTRPKDQWIQPLLVYFFPTSQFFFATRIDNLNLHKASKANSSPAAVLSFGERMEHVHPESLFKLRSIIEKLECQTMAAQQRCALGPNPVTHRLMLGCSESSTEIGKPIIFQTNEQRQKSSSKKRYARRVSLQQHPCLLSELGKNSTHIRRLRGRLWLPLLPSISRRSRRKGPPHRPDSLGLLDRWRQSSLVIQRGNLVSKYDKNVSTQLPIRDNT